MEYKIEHAAVIGAGTMGAAIAAHLANAGVQVLLLDIAPDKLTDAEAERGLDMGDPRVRNRIVRDGWERCLKARPANLFSEQRARLVQLGNLTDDFDKLAGMDWIIEAVVERLEIKQPLMERIEAVRAADCIVSSNTSGLPIAEISAGRSDEFLTHFLGTHFFNPPRYLKLLELIPGEQTKPEIVDFIERFANHRLGKGVIRCKDTPNFVANRLFSLVNSFTLDYAFANEYTVQQVDRLTGTLVGHPKTATFRLLDLVGLDVMADVRNHLFPALEGDPFREVLNSRRNQEVVGGAVERGWLGRKTEQGFYKRVEGESGREFWWLDPNSWEYQPPADPRFDSIGKHKDVSDIGERIKLIVGEDDRAAQFIWQTTAFACRYAAYLVPGVAADLLSIDRAMKWGFMHELGPFEIWDAIGAAAVVERIEADGETVAAWVKQMLESGHQSFYQREAGQAVAYYDPTIENYAPITADPNVISIEQLKAAGGELQSNGSASLVDMGDGVLLLEFHSAAANALDPDILEMGELALATLAEPRWAAMVVGNQGRHFCAGANIFAMAVAAQQGDLELIDQEIRQAQSMFQRMRASLKPVVVAPFSMALAGGAEVVLAGSRVVAAAESYIGLIEMGVGLIPAGTGTKEMMRRLLGPVMQTENADVLPHLQRVFELIALAKVSESAEQAREMGFLRDSDRIVMNQDHLLAEAKRTALQMAAAGYRPEPGDGVWAAGRDALADLKMMVWSMVDGGYASEYDGVLARKLARVLTGGDLTEPGWVPEQYILDLEREAFIELAAEPKTQERMWHMLQHRKPLRN